MPTGIITQPDADQIMAAYRPIIFRVGAIAINSDPVPPVVYCDIYFNGVFYRTISKSQYANLNSGFSEWEFDIQDAAQEYLAKYLGTNGGESIVVADPLVTLVKCKFRSSGLDSEGFIEQEGTIPVQGTGDTNPSAGDGTESNEFNIVNAALQHEDNQDLAAHLDAYKNRTWDATTYPLTHRPDHYKLCALDSDYFPILSDKVPTRLRIHYIPKGATEYVDEDGTEICIPVSFTNFTLPNPHADSAYSFVLPLSGSGPFGVIVSQKPDWMSIDVDGNTLVFSGTPGPGDIALHVEVSATVSNCSGGNSQPFTEFMNVLPGCIPPGFTDFELPDATANAPFNYTVPLSGTSPFTRSITSKPDWMTINISGSNLVFSGTPAQSDVADDVPVQVTVSNCGGDTGIDKTIDVLETQNYILSSSYNMSIDSVTGSGIPALGSTGINHNLTGHQTGMSGTYAVVISGTAVLPTIHLDFLKNSSLIETIHVPGAGTYTFGSTTPISASESDTVIIAINS
jgi:hypothetical protein